jgi:hypothetical protein
MVPDGEAINGVVFGWLAGAAVPSRCVRTKTIEFGGRSREIRKSVLMTRRERFFRPGRHRNKWAASGRLRWS